LADQLAARVRAEVEDQGTQQVLLAQRAGFSEKHVSMMLTGKVDGSIAAWERLADALGCQWAVHLIDSGSP